MRGEAILPVHVIGLELNLYRFPDDPVHASGFFGQNTGVLQLDTMAQVINVLPQQTSRGGRDRCVGSALSPSFQSNVHFIQCTSYDAGRECCIQLAFLGPGYSRSSPSSDPI
jgi:hypothetical protein